MEIKENAMQVWMVMAGFESGGDNGETLRLFDCKSAAEQYGEELKDSFDNYDYITIKVIPVNM